MSLRESIEEIVQNLIDDEIFIIDVSVSGSNRHQKITVLLDGDNGLTIDRCAKLSRLLGEEIEQKGFLEDSYILEVSSPGIDYPLKFPRQYKRNIGRKLKLQLKNELVKQGVLKEVRESIIVIEEEIEVKNSLGKVLKNKKAFQDVEIPLNEIKKTNVVISFS